MRLHAKEREPGIEVENKMAKVRRSRRKFHLSAVKPNEIDKTNALMPNEVDKSSVHTIMLACGLWNIIINLKCKLNELTIFRRQSTLPAIFPIDGLFNPNKAISSETTDSHEVQKHQVNKKDKRKERHERFLQSGSY